MMAVGNSEARRGPRNYVVTLYRFDSKILGILFSLVTFDSFLRLKFISILLILFCVQKQTTIELLICNQYVMLKRHKPHSDRIS